MTQASQLLKWSREVHRCQDNIHLWVSISHDHKRVDVVLRFLWQLPVSRLCVVFHLCPHLFSQYYNRLCQRRAKRRAGTLHEATPLLTQYCAAVFRLGPFIMAWKVTGLGQAICPLLPWVNCAIELQSKPSWPTAHVARETRGINYSWPQQE